MHPDLKRPLKFGDKDQIKALKHECLNQEFKELPDCVICGGDGEKECDCCGSYDECLSCDGTGKDFAAVRSFKEKHPNFKIGLR